MTTRKPLAAEVRHAAPADVDPLAVAFARAFYGDPLMTWVVPTMRPASIALQRFFRHGLARMVRTGVRDVFVTADVAGGATWARPGAWKLPARSMLPGVPGMLRAIGHGGLMRIARAYTFLQSKHPHEPHWYLEGIATDPAQQRHSVVPACGRSLDRARPPRRSPLARRRALPCPDARASLTAGNVDMSRRITYPRKSL